MRTLQIFPTLAQLCAAVILTAGTNACTSPLPEEGTALFTPLQYSANQPVSYDPETEYLNPILPGFYPDPSICRKDGDYYIVTSTFGYFPGLPVWHSTDLVHWELTGHALSRYGQMPIPDLPIRMGVFAPQISYNPGNGLFYIINTVVGGIGNFFVTTDDPLKGEWSDPVRLPDVLGIDPSILFDTDGKAYIVSSEGLAGAGLEPLYDDGDNAILMLEFDWRNGKTTGERKILAMHGADPSSNPRWLEGPHLYHIGDKYFLMCAEGGTEQGHSEVIFQSDRPDGGFEPCAINPILTQRDLPVERENLINCTGHAGLVQTEAGNWYAVFLGVEPYEGDYYFNNGRQTFLLPVQWIDGQPVILPQGQPVPKTVPLNNELKALAAANTVAGFDGFNPGPLWDKDGIADFAMFIRRPVPAEGQSDFDFVRDRKNGPFYRIDDHGNLSLSLKPVSARSLGNPSAICERITSKKFSASTKLSFRPTAREDSSATMAGLLLYQNHRQLMQFVKTLDETGSPVLRLDQIRKGEVERRYDIGLTDSQARKPVYLMVETLTPSEYAFSYSFDGKIYIRAGEALDGKVLSTLEGGDFQGAVIGIYATSAE
ncbi:MAG: glycoside hydrolase family 43 protein [Bacteroidales bacterium]|nr:glycoside hydrolase family 43 protein [Bacteroidales bacterium]